MIVNDAILSNKEKVIIKLKELYSESGYKTFRMSKFEEYDFYARNKDFLVSDNVITFTDTTGKLMALKPDVTLSIVKSGKDLPDIVNRLYYNESVYRVSKGVGTFTEITQTGLECIGRIEAKEIAEVIQLAVKSLRIFSEKPVLALSDLAVTEAVIAKAKVRKDAKAEILEAIEQRNLQKIESILGPCSDVKKLLEIQGPAALCLPKLKEFADGYKGPVRRFVSLLERLEKTEAFDSINIDFSVIDDVNYYNGIVFKGFVPGLYECVLSGGEYDNLMRKLGRDSKAIGFAVYTDLLDRLPSDMSAEKEYINVALPKGRLGEKVYALFEKAGYDCPQIKEENRRLVFENPEKGIRFFWVKPSDVAIYVERGAADIGVAGKDILMEYEPDVYELADLGIGQCRMAVAGTKGFKDDGKGSLKVATKFKNIALSHYTKLGRDIDIIELNGSIELAPILGLSDVIVDIVETGTTLRENDLEELEKIFDISARLIANKSSYSFNSKKIEKINAGLAAASKEKQ